MAKPNVKELVVNHFEKGIFAVVALVALALLAGTRWAPYDRYPTEITRAVNEAEQKVAGNNWSEAEEEQQKFVVPREKTVESLVALHVGHQIDPTPYEFDVSFSPGLYDTTKPITEPEFVGVAELIADAGRFLMATPVERKIDPLTQEDPAMVAENDAEEDEEADIPDEFKTRRTGPGGRPGAGGLGGAGVGLGMGGAGGYEDYAGEFAMDDAAAYGMEDPAMMMMGEYAGMLPEGEGMMGEMGMGAVSAPTMEGRGLRYVSVRGIVPLREQIRKYMKSIHVGFAHASSLYEIIEFELERKKMQPGDDPWGGPWEPVDINIAIDTLNEALYHDPEVVQGSITDTAITMPLPGRVMGVWKSKATHPRLENFTLSPEEIEKELAFNQMLLQKYEEQQQSEPEIVQKGGFSGIAYDSRSMQMGAMGMEYGDAMMQEYDYADMNEEMMGAGMGMMSGINYAPTSKANLTPEAKKFLSDLEKNLGKNPEAKDRETALLEYIQERVTAQGELLLFRYFDFDVEPGATYKYRSRLVIRNPNYGLLIAQVAGLAHIVEGQTRKSDWSNETPPTTVPLDVDYFVDKIDEKGGGFAEARMAVFQWNPDYGTTIHSSLTVGFGQEVGGPKNTLVLDPAANSFEVEPYTFHTGDVLVDALPEDKIRSTDHPDLELPRAARGSLGISGQVLISQGNGELAVIDHLSRMSAFKTRRDYLEYEQAPYEEIKNRAARKPDMTDLESYAGEYGMEMMGAEMGMEGMEGMEGMYGGYGAEDYGRSGRRRGSALRKRPSRGRSAPRGMP